MRVLSGIQPTGRPHWGNYFGAIRQYIALQSMVGLIAMFYVVFNLIVDVIAGYVDPRTRDRRVNA